MSLEIDNWFEIQFKVSGGVDIWLKIDLKFLEKILFHKFLQIQKKKLYLFEINYNFLENFIIVWKKISNSEKNW